MIYVNCSPVNTYYYIDLGQWYNNTVLILVNVIVCTLQCTCVHGLKNMLGFNSSNNFFEKGWISVNGNTRYGIRYMYIINL